MEHFENFIFEDYSFNEETRTAFFRYSYDEKIHFEERLVFDFPVIKDFDINALEGALQGLWLMLGISYFKAFLPPHIQIKKQTLSSAQKIFFEKIYTQGLGEFLYQNNISLKKNISFPPASKKALPKLKSHTSSLEGSLVLVGGGKDSLTTAEILKAQKEDFETLTVGEYPFFKGMIQKIGHPHYTVKRFLDPKIFNLNALGAYNGHVPISSILAFISVLVALLRGKKYILLSNEHSANEPNLVLPNGQEVNHQYSKSETFEMDFQNYLHTFISPDLEYFSFLRPLSEYQIAEIFCRSFFKKYKSDFSSCNTNFKRQNTAENFQWCGKCPKCAFVFLLFSPFLSRKQLNHLFGKDLLQDPDLEETFLELLGLQGHKPFECVGEIQEVRWAVEQAQKKKDYEDFKKFSFPPSSFEKKLFRSHFPSKFKHTLTDFLTQKL